MNEYAIFADRLDETGSPEMVVVLDDEGVTGICRDQDAALRWREYFSDSKDWSNTHLFDDHPLQSVFRNPYLEVQFKDIDGEHYGQDVEDLMDEMEEDGDIYMFHVPLE